MDALYMYKVHVHVVTWAHAPNFSNLYNYKHNYF